MKAHFTLTTEQYDHVSPALKELSWLPVKEHLYYRDAVISFKCLTGCAPEYLSTKFIRLVISQIAEREVLKCLTYMYLTLELQVAKGLFSLEQLIYGINCLNFVNQFMCLNAALGLTS